MFAGLYDFYLFVLLIISGAAKSLITYSLRLSFDVFWPFVLSMMEPNMWRCISSRKLDWLKQLL